MDKILETIERIWENPFVKSLCFLILAFLSAWIASFIVKKFLKLLKLDAKLDKWGINEGQDGTAIKFIGKLVFAIVFLLFLPAVLGALGLEGVSDPITDFVSSFVGYIPNIIAALALVFIGIFLGQILGQVVAVLLAKAKLDNLTKKLPAGGEGVKLSAIVGKIVNAVIVLIAIVQALTVLDVAAISDPALEIIGAVFGAIPSIILAIIVLVAGILIASVACGLLNNLLLGVNFDGIIAKIAPAAKDKISPTKLLVGILRVVIILFVIAEGVDILGLEILTGIMSVIISYLPLVIKAVLIAIVAFLGAGLLGNFISKLMPGSKVATGLVKAIIYVIAGFMVLSQLDFATVIVNYAFIIIIGALAVAFAVAFGIGGRDFAKRTLEKVNTPAVKSGEEKQNGSEEQNSNE